VETGLAYFATHDAIDPGSLASMVEQRGHSSLFFPDHTHIPSSLRSQLPEGGELPRKYAHLYDLFVSLTMAAGATNSLRIGSGICLIVERDPIITAKQVASIDHVSGGRIEFGMGAGWNSEEMMNHGTDPRRRFRLMRERVEAMKQIWGEERASYDGEFVSFEEIWSWPKPVQQPHPPLLVGGDGPTVLDRVLAYGDAWMPDYAPEGIFERLPELRARAADAGRKIEVVMMGVPADPAVLDRCREEGVAKVLHWLPSTGRGPIERELERFEQAVAISRGEVQA
jgi:probable F420-dependent oxidoreductase